MTKLIFISLLMLSGTAFAQNPKTPPQPEGKPEQNTNGGIPISILDKNPSDHPSVIIGNPNSVLVNPNSVLIENKILHMPMPHEESIFQN